jgi:formylglycine-generating enzyme required for sulfatase activity
MHEVLRTPRDGRGEWTLARLVGALLRVSEALTFAHDRGVVHRDLKPANVMLGEYGEVYVMDWGLARVRAATDAAASAAPAAASGTAPTAPHDARATHGPYTLDGDVVGTPQYMAPEQAAGRLADVGPRSDVYGLGAMLYHVLCGHAPYHAGDSHSSAVQVLALVRAGPPAAVGTLAPDAPAELQAVCRKSMARDPADRYESMDELAADLRAWLEGRVVGAHERGPWAELRKWIARNRALSAASAAALLAIFGGLAWSSHVETVGRKAAETAGARADASLRDLRSLSEIKRVAEMEARADALWPADAERAPALGAWLAEARELAGHLDAHRATLARVQQGEEASGLERSWWEETLAELIGKLETFADEVIPEVEGRLAFAQSVEDRSITRHRAEWDEAIAAIADAGRSPAYGGLVIAPQLGLVPLGPDPGSRLWEFWNVQTGERPERGAEGAIMAGDDMGLVFVLLPGGTFHMGSQPDDPQGPNYDPQSVSDEQPVAEVTLDPFFLSKFEMTQAQWERVARTRPSQIRPGEVYGGVAVTRHDPVENVTRNESHKLLLRLGMDLPTEAQWEYAARGGTGTPWWTGADRESLRGAENIADASAVRLGATWSALSEWPENDDGMPLHGPVGSFRPNPFGLYDMCGNVWEWTRDWYEKYPATRGAGDGATQGEPRAPTLRGGVYGEAPSRARCANRDTTAWEAHLNAVGLRPMLALRRP